jgi:hypothetical protein
MPDFTIEIDIDPQEFCGESSRSEKSEILRTNIRR